jgi:glutamyl-Q tRNA(Asp) synthetase
LSAELRYRGRFAPSPSGALHFGSLVAAMASWCDARASKGDWLLRIEDVDQTRSRPGASDGIFATLEAYGFEWNGPVVRQSERAALYAAALDDLIRRRLAFTCACTRRELELAAPVKSGERVYPGTCRQGVPAGREGRSWRVAVTDEIVSFHDRLQGMQEQQLARDVGDFVLKRADGLFAYQLAVVVDDGLQGITHIVRGADLLSSTPRQIWLQRQLGYATPSYLHHPIALDARGRKLSKQAAARALSPDPLSELCEAWKFLDQPEPPSPPESVGEFWRWAHAAWNVRRLPPVIMLPAPRSCS